MDRRTVRINVGNGYDVYIENGIISRCGEILKKTAGHSRAAIITDSNVAKLYLEKVVSSVNRENIRADSFVFDAGEKSKSMETLEKILEYLAENRFTKSDTIIALGGGVTGDLAGFAASVYLRGINLIQMPTTLLSAVDSSIGGKTAVNLSSGKNLAGTFKQPRAVICDPGTFSTLPDDEFRNGMAEVIKYGVLFSEEMFDCLSDGATEDIGEIIERCVAFKGKTVENDEFDSGERKLLNLGHTVGHSIEKCSDFNVPHGFAVAAGMAIIARAGEKAGITHTGTARRIESVLKKNGRPVDCEFSAKRLVLAALLDKKRDGDRITLVIPVKIGKSILKDFSVNDLEDFIDKGKS